MKKLLNKCPVCGAKLEYSTMMQYALNYQIKRNGELSVKSNKSDCGSMECGFISCKNIDCDFATDCTFHSEKHPEIKVYPINGKFYYEKEEE